MKSVHLLCDNHLRLLLWALLGIALLSSILAAPYLAANVAIHWNTTGAASGYGSSWFALLLMPALLLVIALGMPALLKLKGIAINKNDTVALGHYGLEIGVALSTFLLVLHLLMLAINTGWPIPILPALAIELGALFYFLGSIMPHVPPNWVIGVRTPWALRDEKVWKAVHARAGPLFQICGLLALVALVWQTMALFWMVVPVLLAAVYLVVYSYQLYAKKHSD